MSSPVVDFGKNFLNLKYQVGYRCFSFTNRESRKDFVEFMDKNILKNNLFKVSCNDKTFSSIDGASKKFIESDFYMNMLDSLGYSRNEDIIKNMKGFKKIDINYDAYCGRDRTFIKQVFEPHGNILIPKHLSAIFLRLHLEMNSTNMNSMLSFL